MVLQSSMVPPAKDCKKLVSAQQANKASQKSGPAAPKKVATAAAGESGSWKWQGSGSPSGPTWPGSGCLHGYGTTATSALHPMTRKGKASGQMLRRIMDNPQTM